MDTTMSATPNDVSKTPNRSASTRAHPTATGSTAIGKTSRRASAPPGRREDSTFTTPSSGRSVRTPKAESRSEPADDAAI